RVETGDTLFALLGHAPQDGIDEAGKMSGAAIVLRNPHREIDGGMIGDIEEQDLRGADQKRRFDPRRIRRGAAVEQAGKHFAQSAEPAQHGADNVARECTVALGEEAEAVVALAVVELLVERTAAAQHVVENILGDAPRWQTGNFSFHRNARHPPCIAREASERMTFCEASSREVRDASQITPEASSREV